MTIEQRKTVVPIEHLRVQMYVLQALLRLYEVMQDTALPEKRRGAAVVEATCLLREIAGQLSFSAELCSQVNELACLVEYLTS